METNVIRQGDALSVLKTLPINSIDMVMTSPPYWNLRDYGVEGQLGLEPTFEEYISKLCNIFDEVRYVLKEEGTCWVNIGDSYAGSSKGFGGKDHGKLGKHANEFLPKPTKTTIPDKSLCMIPFCFAIEMVNRGWILRNTIIWHKPNCMPESVKDRFTTDFEYLFFFSKSKKYYFEPQYEPLADSSIMRLAQDTEHQKGSSRANGGAKTNGTMKAVSNTRFGGNKAEGYGKRQYSGKGWIPTMVGGGNGFAGHSGYFDKNGNLLGNGMRNKRCVWKIPPKPFKEAHFATYPPELCETPIRAGCPEFICIKCGKARERICEKKFVPQNDVSLERNTKKSNKGMDQSNGWGDMPRGTNDYKFLKYSDCGCNAGFEGGIVLDPFMGSGTTAVVAQKLGRQYIGIELNKSYIEIAEKRLAQRPLLVAA